MHVVELAPELGIGGEAIEAVRDGGKAEEVGEREVGEDAEEELVGKG